MKYFKIKHIALLLAVTSAPLYTACDFMDCSETDYYSKQQILDNMDRVKQLATQVYSYLPHDFCNTSGAMQDAATDDAIHVYESSAINVLSMVRGQPIIRSMTYSVLTTTLFMMLTSILRTVSD